MTTEATVVVLSERGPDRLGAALDDVAIPGATLRVERFPTESEPPDVEDELAAVTAELRQLGDGSVPEDPDALSADERAEYDRLKERFESLKRMERAEHVESYPANAAAALLAVDEDAASADVASSLCSLLDAHVVGCAFVDADPDLESLTRDDLLDPDSLTESDIRTRLERTRNFR